MTRKERSQCTSSRPHEKPTSAWLLTETFLVFSQRHWPFLRSLAHSHARRHPSVANLRPHSTTRLRLRTKTPRTCTSHGHLQRAPQERELLPAGLAPTQLRCSAGITAVPVTADRARQISRAYVWGAHQIFQLRTQCWQQLHNEQPEAISPTPTYRLCNGTD